MANMIDVILHIGLGKCGSSALQQALSENPNMKSKDKKYKNIKYVNIDSFGDLHFGEQLKIRSLSSPSGYSATCQTQAIFQLSDASFQRIKKRLKMLSNDNNTLIIMSCEGWTQQIEFFRTYAILEKLGIRAKAIAYVRNPVEWINSAWWQWGAWSQYDLDGYVEDALEAHVTKWHIKLKKWEELLGKNNVTVKVLPRDIVSDFYEFVGADMDDHTENRNNTSLPGEILRFYQKHRELRKAPHDFTMDFILSKSMDFDSTYSKTPWVLSTAMIDKIIARSRTSNQSLMALLESDSIEICKQDKKWWDADAFSNKESMLEPYKDEPVDYTDLDKLLLESFKSIKRLSLENGKLKRNLYMMRHELETIKHKT